MLSAIYNTFCNCFKIPELKSRLLFTLLVLAICRLEAVVRIPGLNGTVLANYFNSQAGSTAGGGMLGMYRRVLFRSMRSRVIPNSTIRTSKFGLPTSDFGS